MITLPPSAENIIRQIPGSVGIKSLDSTYIAGNNYYAKIAGLPDPNDFLGRTDNDLVYTAEFADYYVSQDRLIIETKKTLRSLQFKRCADKPYRLFYSVKKPFYNDLGDMIGVIGHGTSLDDRFITSLSSAIGLNKDIDEKPFDFKEYQDALKTTIKLTSRESDVLFYLMRGRTYKGIANILNLSARTIESHMNALKEKLNCQTKSQLIEYSLAHGLYQIIPMTIASQWLS